MDVFRLATRADNPGTKLSSLLGNTDRFLIVSTPFKDLIAAACKRLKVEYLPFTLLDHGKRVLAADYWFVNPIGARKSWVGKTLPALFRVERDPTQYFVTGDLAKAIRKHRLTNVELEKLPTKP